MSTDQELMWETLEELFPDTSTITQSTMKRLAQEVLENFIAKQQGRR